jgi:hypothetical protein
MFILICEEKSTDRQEREGLENAIPLSPMKGPRGMLFSKGSTFATHAA